MHNLKCQALRFGRLRLVVHTRFLRDRLVQHIQLSGARHTLASSSCTSLLVCVSFACDSNQSRLVVNAKYCFDHFHSRSEVLVDECLSVFLKSRSLARSPSDPQGLLRLPTSECLALDPVGNSYLAIVLYMAWLASSGDPCMLTRKLCCHTYVAILFFLIRTAAGEGNPADSFHVPRRLVMYRSLLARTLHGSSPTDCGLCKSA